MNKITSKYIGKQKIYLLGIIIILLIFISFSYYLLSLSNDNKQIMKTASGSMQIVYTDCAENKSEDCANINKNLSLGESVIKTFRVENTGTLAAGFEIIFKSVNNTFVNNELVYKLVDDSDEIVIPEKPVPYGTNEGVTIFKDTILSGTNKTYKLIITFKEFEHDQEVNKTASYDITLGIKSSSTVTTQNTFAKLQSLNPSLKVNSVVPNFANISPMPSKYRDDGVQDTEYSHTLSSSGYLTYADSYTFNQTTGYYTLVNPKTCKYDECYSQIVGKYYCYNAFYNNTSLHYDSNQKDLYQITSNSTSEKIYYKSAEKTILEYDDKDSGLFEAEDDYGKSLYFRGNVVNNYVKFGKNKNGQDMYFRIIRINGDGTLRLLYDGTQAYENGTSSTDRIISKSQYNYPYDNGYLGYMFGDFEKPTGCECSSYASNGKCIYTCTGGGSTSYEQAHNNINSSLMKIYLENWYEENILNTGYSNYVADEIFCNDRSKRPNDLGYGQNYTIYAAYTRFQNKTPSLICARKHDAFTVNNTIKGNASLKYPVGLITGDELAFGGNVYNGDYNVMSYLYKGPSYWSMTPSHLTSYKLPYMIELSEKIGVYNTGLKTVGIAPVINLSLEAVELLSGKGTKEEPYVIQNT